MQFLLVPGLIGLVDGLGGVGKRENSSRGCFLLFFFFIFGTAEWLVVPVCSPPPQAELGWRNGPAGPAGPSAITL